MSIDCNYLNSATIAREKDRKDQGQQSASLFATWQNEKRHEGSAKRKAGQNGEMHFFVHFLSPDFANVPLAPRDITSLFCNFLFFSFFEQVTFSTVTGITRKLRETQRLESCNYLPAIWIRESQWNFDRTYIRVTAKQVAPKSRLTKARQRKISVHRDTSTWLLFSAS